METNVNYTIVGFFVIVLTAFIILGIIWLSAGFSYESSIIYQVNMEEAVSGLNMDAPIEFNGVNVGRVYKISLNPANPRQVELLIRIKKDTPITQGTRAKLEMRALTGVSYLSLIDQGDNLAPLAPLPGQKYAIIKTIPSFLLKLDAILTQIDKAFTKISHALNSLLDPENLAQVKQSLKNINRITSSFANHTAQFESILQNTAKASSLLQSKTIPDANQFITNLNALSSNLNEISSDLKRNPTLLIRGRPAPVLGPGEK